MDDLISRQAAIDAIERHIRPQDGIYHLSRTDEITNHALEIAASCVYNLPSAQPKHKTGGWIINDEYEPWMEKCLTCQFLYIQEEDADTYSCQCENGCNYKRMEVDRERHDIQG